VFVALRCGQLDVAAERVPHRDAAHDRVLEVESPGGTVERVGSGSGCDRMLATTVELLT
jgi:hypothetical protein